MNDDLSWEDTSPIMWLSLLAIIMLITIIVYQIIKQPRGWMIFVILDSLIIILNIYATTRLIYINQEIRLRKNKLEELWGTKK